MLVGGDPRLSALQQECAKLKAQLKQLQSPSQSLKEEPQDEPEADAKGNGDEVAKLQSAHDAVLAALGADSQVTKDLAAQLGQARQARLAAKPLATQTLAAQRIVDKKAKAIQVNQKLLDALADQQKELDKKLLEARADEARLKEELGAAEAVLKDLHLKAVQSSQPAAEGEGPGDPEVARTIESLKAGSPADQLAAAQALCAKLLGAQQSAGPAPARGPNSMDLDDGVFEEFVTWAKAAEASDLSESRKRFEELAAQAAKRRKQSG